MFKKFFGLIGCMILATAGICASPREEIVISEEFISPCWDKYDCHASSLVETTEGEVLVVWKGGHGEGKSNIDIDSKVGLWQSRFDGKKWSLREMIHFETESVVWNPVLTQLSSRGTASFLSRRSQSTAFCGFCETLI